MKRLVAIAIAASLATGTLFLGASTPASANQPQVTFSIGFGGPGWGPGPFWPGPGPGWWGPGPGWGPGWGPPPPYVVKPHRVKCKIVYEYQQVWQWGHWAWVQVPVKKCRPPVVW